MRAPRARTTGDRAKAASTAKEATPKIKSTAPANTALPPLVAFSRAFDSLVGDGNDIVGLLAYALYKQSVRESAIIGIETTKTARNLPRATVDAFRSSAEQFIAQVVTTSIEKATPSIENSAAVAQMDTHHADVIAALARERGAIETHISSRTNFWASLGTNVLAWFISLIIAALVLYLAQQPSLEETVSNVALQGRDYKADQTGQVGQSAPPNPGFDKPKAPDGK